MSTNKRSVPVTYIRGGTSKALFFHEHNVPPPGVNRDRFLRRIMCSPDPLQIDGMGGSHIPTSKIALIRPSDQPDVDVDYTFVQVGIDNDVVGYSGNCGNISAGVGPFTIDEGLAKRIRPGVSLDPTIKTQEVRIYNTGTKKVLISHVPIDPETGKSLEDGSFSIAGCPGTGAPILMDYSNVTGACLNKGALPTNNVLDETTIDGSNIQFTICDIGNILVFVRADDMGALGSETYEVLDQDKPLIARIRKLRGKAAQMVGMCKDWELVDDQSPMIPMVVLVSLPTNPDCHVQARLFLDNMCHPSMAGTGAICTAACSRIPGSIVTQMMFEGNLQKPVIEIQHALGHMPVVVKVKPGLENRVPEFETLSFIRTSRRILEGNILIPGNVKDCFDDQFNGVIANGASSDKAYQNDTRSTEESKPLMNRSAPATTKDFAEFVSGLRYDDLTPKAKEKLQLLLLDYIGVAAAATQLSESSASFVGCMKALNGGGVATAVANGQTWPAPLAAMLNGALHPGASVISAALAEAETNAKATTEDFFTALATGYEVTCRLGVALGTGGYDLGFHNACTAGIFGAIAVIGKLRKGNANTIADAFGIAISKVSGSMQYLTNGSWNKRLHPGFAAHDAFICYTLAEAGVLGAADPIEGKFGLLNVYSSLKGPLSPRSPLPFKECGEFLSVAIKPFPACRMTHGHIELATKMSEGQKAGVKSITASLSKECYPIVGEPKPSKVHPKNVVDAQFSTFYQTAIAWLHGSKLGWKVYDYIQDTQVYDLLEKVKTNVNDSYKGLETSLKVEWDNRIVQEEYLKNPIGEPDNPATWDDVCTKFMSITAEVYGKERARKVCEVVDRLDTHGIHKLMDLVK
ncbi:uncharacterized protein Z518_02150 [Rhinocladiella mackenziei CBS 650.93]|uniref:Uncharacterized protein n=1 Tax=Rhinocladiella mackenziei CBS 650.93 TaxID=1442369 RepID=A0A0D2FZ03_9EURO|nr:uncharacterized protein Z518_02150 [Rhinocladiella mackenziei CBS 650.93]KIX07497.1 hypothetical protein Z518_02150 [Rhinocladiella mackenziei CBS 650.93]